MSNTLDQAWTERMVEIKQERRAVQDRILATDYYWGPIPGETALEIAWEKVRIDATEAFGQQVDELGEPALRRGDVDYPDTYAIANKAMLDVLGDGVRCDDRGIGDYALKSLVTVESYGMLNNMLGRIVGVYEDGMIVPREDKQMNGI